MKARVFSGSPTVVYQEPRRKPPFLLVILRRYPVTILVIICVILSLAISWFFQGKEEYALSNTEMFFVHKNFINEFQTLDSNRMHFLHITKISDNTEKKQNEFMTDEQFPDNNFVPPNIEIQPFAYRDQEYENIRPVQDEMNEYKMRQFDEQETPTILNAADGLFQTAKEDVPVYLPEYRYVKESFFEVIQNERPVTLFNIKHPIEGFPIPVQGTEWVKIEHVTVSIPINKTETLETVQTDRTIDTDTDNSPSNTSYETSPKSKPTFLIDTPGCKIPKLDPWDPTVKGFIELQDPYVCPGAQVFLKSNPGGSITLDRTILENYYNKTADQLICYFQPIYRKYEEEGSVQEINFGLGNLTKLKFDTPLNEDYVRVICNVRENKYEQYFPLVRLREDVEQQRSIINPPDPTLNVILIGIDSVSKLNFLRHFPKTHAFLNEKLKPFEMNGYTKVGDNTFPNLVPLLTGQFVEYWWNETVKDTMFFDDIGLIWKEYAKRGYRTFYAEDYPYAGTFQYLKRGFYNPPTDYYFRPLALALEMWKSYAIPEKEFCLNSQIEFEIIYDYLKDFAQTMETRPYFGFGMVSTITHDVLNNAGWVDEPTVNLLEGLMNVGALNNTLLVLFSDHGIRYGEIRGTFIGKFEERLPLMYIHVPQWFLDKYPQIAKNLETNQHRIMTLFDIHATMLHLLDLNKSEQERSKGTLGKSLFEEISQYRTCLEANIQTHWCPCRTFDIVALNSLEVLYASQAIVNGINSKLHPYWEICEILEVNTIYDARVGKVSELMLQYPRTVGNVTDQNLYVVNYATSLNDYMVTLTTKPGGAIFEGTVRHNTDDNSFHVLGLSRVNMYRNTSWCIDSQSMKIFCYCKIQID